MSHFTTEYMSLELFERIDEAIHAMQARHYINIYIILKIKYSITIRLSFTLRLNNERLTSFRN